MTRIITDDEFVKAFDAAVEERGRGFVYPQEWKRTLDGARPVLEADATTCLYNLEDGAPACVFGLAFHKLGLAPATDVITDILDMTSTMTREEFCSSLDSEGPLEDDPILWRERSDVEFQLSPGVRDAAMRAQVAQDAGFTWGQASDKFHRAIDGEAPGAD